MKSRISKQENIVSICLMFLCWLSRLFLLDSTKRGYVGIILSTYIIINICTSTPTIWNSKWYSLMFLQFQQMQRYSVLCTESVCTNMYCTVSYVRKSLTVRTSSEQPSGLTLFNIKYSSRCNSECSIVRKCNQYNKESRL